jgi:hypothetical protein
MDPKCAGVGPGALAEEALDGELPPEELALVGPHNPRLLFHPPGARDRVAQLRRRARRRVALRQHREHARRQLVLACSHARCICSSRGGGGGRGDGGLRGTLGVHRGDGGAARAVRDDRPRVGLA